jgi:hypothetical protein
MAILYHCNIGNFRCGRTNAAPWASEDPSNYLKFLQMMARVETEIDVMDNDATGPLDREIDRFLSTALA